MQKRHMRKFTIKKLIKSRRKLAKEILINLAIIFIFYYMVQTYYQWDTPHGQAPGIQGVHLDQTPINIPHDLDQATLVHFWATWCGVCRLEQNSIDRISDDYPVIAIASQSGSYQTVKNAVTERKIRVPVLVDETGILAKQYGVKAFPSSFIVDKEGQIRFTEVGYSTEWGLRFRLWWSNL